MDRVVAQTEGGLECGEIKVLRDVVGTRQDAPSEYNLLRRATKNDLQQVQERQQQSEDALETCRKRAERLALPMKVTDAEISFDGSTATFYFVSDNRIDFRQLEGGFFPAAEGVPLLLYVCMGVFLRAEVFPCSQSMRTRYNLCCEVQDL